MWLLELINQIMPKLRKVIDMINDDKLIRIELDEAYDNAILLTFQEYDTFDYRTNRTYQMRAIIGKERIIYENAVNGVDYRDFIGDEIDISIEEYDAIMNL